MAANRKMAGVDHLVMRELNRSLVVDVLKHRDSPTSRAAIAKATGLAKPTVSAIVDDLVTEKLVNETGIGQTTAGGGRPPILLEYNARSQFVAGVHIGVQTTTIVIADGLGVEIGRLQSKTRGRRPREMLLRVAKDVQATLAEAGGARSRLAAVGVCIPALIDRETGTCLLAPNLGWANVDAGGILEQALGVSVYVHNTHQAAAVAESIEGAGQDATDIVFLYAGSGIGAGIITEGRLLHGGRGITGEIGHCRIDGSTAKCGCGKVGCLETVATGSAIGNAATAAVRSGRSSSLAGPRGSTITPEQVAAAAAEGDALAIELLEGAGVALGTAAGWLVNLFNPEMLIVGGGLVDAGAPLVDPLRDTIWKTALPQITESLAFATSELGQDAEVRGAVLLALQFAETYYRVIFQG